MTQAAYSIYLGLTSYVSEAEPTHADPKQPIFAVSILANNMEGTYLHRCLVLNASSVISAERKARRWVADNYSPFKDAIRLATTSVVLDQ